MTSTAGPSRRPSALDREGKGRKRSKAAQPTVSIVLKNGHFWVEFQYDAWHSLAY
jgi:hypothetical protein